jgi:tetratricopeptide (TPR) repeat protein
LVSAEVVKAVILRPAAHRAADNERLTAFPVLTATELTTATDPAALLDHAWAMEPALALTERYAALDRLEELIDQGLTPPPPPGRDWRLELLAERAFDAAAYVRLADAQRLAGQVLEEAGPGVTIARARATLARGRALAWSGTEEGTHRGDQVLLEAIELFRLLDHTDWLGFTIFWRGHAICFQNGDLEQAVALIGEGLEILGPNSPRRSAILTFYGDVLCEMGDFDAADSALEEAVALAERDGFARSKAYAAWTSAHVSAGRDDASATLGHLRAVEQNAGDWFSTMTGLDFLADAANQLDRVGLTRQAEAYLERARERVRHEGPTTADGSEYDEPLLQAEAMILARSGDPHAALAKLEQLVRGNWLENRLIWRNTLLTAWATLRAGGREDAAVITARALAEVASNGGLGVALAGERLITRALAPLADEAGSAHARQLLSHGELPLIRLFGTPSAETPDGRQLVLPGGKPGELVRWLALHPRGLPVEVVLEQFFPDTERTIALQRLRQVLKRVRASLGTLVLRRGELLVLVPAWIDIREFQRLAEAALSPRGDHRRQLAWAALALAERGPLLASDPYAPWAELVREEIAASTVALGAALARDR